MPKVGPLKTLSLRLPTPQTEAMFRSSFNTALDQYLHLLDDQRAGQLHLVDRNFDTGALTKPGAYFMADRAYERLVDDLAKNRFQDVSPGLRADILAYYRDPAAPIVTKKDAKAWNRLSDELAELKSAGPSQAGSACLPASNPASSR